MNSDIKIYGALGFNPRHIETIDRIYGSVIDADFNLQKQPKRIKEILNSLMNLPKTLRPKFIFEAGDRKPGGLKNLAAKIMKRRKSKN